jgi:hypothetical protein
MSINLLLLAYVAMPLFIMSIEMAARSKHNRLSVTAAAEPGGVSCVVKASSSADPKLVVVLRLILARGLVHWASEPK